MSKYKYKVFNKGNNSYLESTYQNLVDLRNKNLEKFGATYYTVVNEKTVENKEDKKDIQTLYDTDEFYTLNDITPDNKWCGQTLSSIVTFNTLEMPSDRKKLLEDNAYKDTLQQMINSLDNKEPSDFPIVDISNENTFTSSDGSEIIIGSGSIVNGYCYDGESGYFQPDYDSSKSYAILSWYDGDSTLVGHRGLSVVNDNEKIGIQNDLSESTKFATAQYAVCSESSALVVPVYNAENTVYNSFKYNMDGTDYWFVLDGEQSEWVSNLSEIGYTVEPVYVFPTVIKTDESLADSIVIESGNGFETSVSYDDESTYAVSTDDGSGNETLYGWVCSKSGSDYVYATNGTDSSITVHGYSVWQCSDSSSDVIRVYSSNNTEYSAFKYSAYGSDYYYVLDGEHSEWVEDLSSIGYSDEPFLILPTVSVSDDFGDYNWLSLTNQANISMNPDEVLSPSTSYQYDSSKSYAVLQWQSESGTTAGRADVAVVNDGGVVKLKNVSSNEIKIKSARVAVCSDSSAGIITVYNSDKDNFNAFVAVANGTTYYYVLDGVQEDWTDDLESLGFYRTVPVSFAGDYGSDNILSANTSGGNTTMQAGGTWEPYVSGTTNTGSYKWSKVYATVYGYDANSGGNRIDPTKLGYTNLKPGLGWKNIGSSEITVSFAKVSLCSNPSAIVVTVYNSSNVAYNAFKYSEDGTDYYYVLDSTQTDWVTDLSEIGYSLDITYPEINQYSGTKTAESIAPGGTFDTGLLYDDNDLYIIVTNDGSGNDTYYGWEAVEGI